LADPGGQQAKGVLGRGAGHGRVEAEDLVRVAAGAEGLVLEGEVADHEVVVVLRAVRTAEDVVVGPPAAEVGVAEGELAINSARRGSSGWRPAYRCRRGVDFDDIDFRTRAYDAGAAYAQSKTANVLFAVEANRRWTATGSPSTRRTPGRSWRRTWCGT
jgi:hypothetical protein